VRRRLVRWGSPSYTLGTICFVRRADGAVLLVRHSYHHRWGTPGGLTKRSEPPEQAVVRETMEEVNLAVELEGEPVMYVNAERGWVDAVFLARPFPGQPLDDVRPSSPEVVAVGWFDLDDLPDLQVDTAHGLAALERAGRLTVTPSSGRR
jgi:8-oxo-dGTP pyrophosphatase MutT (NUDIX family)